jgi:hypothetical protein
MNRPRIFTKHRRRSAKPAAIVIILPGSINCPLITTESDVSPEYRKLAQDLEWLDFALSRIANRVTTFKFDKAA